MSLFSSLQLASNTLQIQQIGLQVVGQNLANASTPGYSREEVVLAPGPTQQVNGNLLGTGVTIETIKQDVDQFLNQRARTALSDQSGSALSSQTYQQLESIFGALNSPNLNTALTGFTSSIAQVLNSPQDVATRNLAVLKGQTLANQINSYASQTNQLRANLNDQIVGDTGRVNGLLTQIGKLNVQIAQTEGGAAGASQAVGLRDQRDQALSSLAGLINIRTAQQNDGSVSVYNGGDYLVAGSEVRQVKVDKSQDRGQTIASVRLASTDSPLDLSSGEIGGLVNSRDGVLGGFLDQLNSFAGALASEFNKVYSTGQGLNGYTSLTGATPAGDVNAPLDAAALQTTPVSGSFQVLVHNKQTGLTQTTDIQVNVNGLAGDTTLSNLATQLNAIPGLAASTTVDGRLKITSTDSNQQFAFSGDTSGTLAALGLNTFFTGSDASSIAVNQVVARDPSTFAASAGGVGVDANVAQQLAEFLTTPLATHSGATIADLYGQVSSNLTQNSSVAKSLSDSAQAFYSSLQGQQQALGGVNIDQETINLLQYQRSYQASAKFISTISDLLHTLVNL